jgi:hypothetical protein
MHLIEMHEASSEFLKCYQAAGLHLNEQVDGGIQFWLKADPTPPWLEHLSFRLGNQLFFVRIEDVDGKLELPGTNYGLESIAANTGGHGCILPMKKKFFGGGWEPSHFGWGLVDVTTRLPINPIDFVTDENIVISDWELQDIAVQVVRTQLEKGGLQLMSWTGVPSIDPSIWFIGKLKEPVWVVVRAARYPQTETLRPNKDFIDEVIKTSRFAGSSGYFASVRVASGDEVFDPMAATNCNYLPIWRGHELIIGYDGLDVF